MAKWSFYLADAATLTNIGELDQARGRSLTLQLNRPGTASFTYPMSEEEYAGQINPLSSALKCYRDGVLMWSGYVATIDEDISGDRMTVNCAGWLQRLDRRFLRRDKNYVYVPGASPPATATAVDDADIIFDLLAEANGVASGEHAAGVNTFALPDPPGTYTVHWPAGSSPNLPTWIKKGAKLPNEGVGGATAYVPAYRGKAYQKYQNILAGMLELTEVENGCDIEVDPATRELNIHRKRQRNLSNVIFGFNWGPKNIQQIGRQLDGTTVTNYHVSTGRSGLTPGYADDVNFGYDSQLAYGPMEETTALSDVSETQTLITNSAVEIILRRHPRPVWNLLPFPYTPESENIPEPFVDYRIGDKVYFTAIRAPRINVQSQASRIFGMTVGITEEGNEQITTLQLQPGA